MSKISFPKALRFEHPIEGLHPAPYNPRRITPTALDDLRHSISHLGFNKPIICMEDGLIIAGHQRTKAATSLGWNTVPAYILGDVKESDQIRFNQLHNGTDMEEIDTVVRVRPSTSQGFTMIAPDDIDGDMRSRGASVRMAMCQLMSIYGDWGASVATRSGEVIGSPHYALCCKILGMPLLVYYVGDEQRKTAFTYMKKEYGQFSYDHLPRNDYIQTYAQPVRLRRGSESVSRGESATYTLALPQISRNERILDFGCGQGDYVKLLTRLNYKIWGIEFFRRRGGVRIDTAAVHRMIDEVCETLTRDGLFDVVICDSVLNSINCQQAEEDVLTCLNAFCKPGGNVYFSGRTREGLLGKLDKRKAAYKSGLQREIEFLDENGMSGLFINGDWFFQKFHLRKDVQAMGPRFFGHEGRYTTSGPKQKKLQVTSWQMHVIKSRELPDDQVEAAIRREFNMKWPAGERIGRGDQAVAAWRAARSLSAAA